MPVIGSSFISTSREVAVFEGVPGQPLVVYPGAIQGHTDDEVKENIEKIFEQVVDGLTKPVGDSGKISNAAPVFSDPNAIVSRGTLERVNEEFHANRWTDGHPIIPPIIEKVHELLKFTDLAPHQEIVTLPIAYLKATPWNIAVNGVMAGCRPEYMPLLIAAVEAIGDPNFDITGLGSTGGYMPFLIVNGPIARQLGIRSDLPAVSHRPNAVMGRALGLITRNIGGFVPGETAMGTFGYILPFVLAEDEEVYEEIGWDPYHVRRGFNKNANVVSAGGSGNWGHQSTPTGDKAEDLLKFGCREVRRRVISERALKRIGATTMFTMVMTPPIAKVFARDGYAIGDLETYWFNNTTLTPSEYDFLSKHGQSNTPAPTIRSLVEDGILSSEWFDRGPNEKIPVLPTPDTLHVIVCGDRGRNKYMSFWAPYFRPASKEVKLPAAWNQLLKQ